jgi:hypothetical protein
MSQKCQQETHAPQQMRLIRSHRRRAQGEFGGKLTPSALAADDKRYADRV